MGTGVRHSGNVSEQGPFLTVAGPILGPAGLGQSWSAWSGLAPRDLTHQELDTIWVSDIAGQSEPMALSGFRVSGFVGRIRYQCDSATVADLVDPLLRLAAYSGVGSAKAKGLGVTRLPGTWQPGARAKAG